jgi:glycosyltransferase involved in cell wall biosynthesis
VSLLRRTARRLVNAAEQQTSRRARADVALFHRLEPAPTGGGSQFLRALTGELERRGLRVEQNRVSPTTRACLYNSFNFDFSRLRGFARDGVRMVHRVDGPIGVYRGFDDGTDRRILEINRELADVTVFQSRYSFEAHRELGLELVAPVVIPNAVDPTIFHPPAHRESTENRKIRLISSSWSDNPNKGGPTYEWLDRNLDRDRFEYTFVGRSPSHFQHARVVPPLPSHALADLLREHDVFVTASVHDPCSNALLEALACGLPAVYVRSGGHPELVGDGGEGFSSNEELLDMLDRVVGDLDGRRARIEIESLSAVASRYLDVLALEASDA